MGDWTRRSWTVSWGSFHRSEEAFILAPSGAAFLVLPDWPAEYDKKMGLLIQPDSSKGDMAATCAASDPILEAAYLRYQSETQPTCCSQGMSVPPR